MLENAKCVVTLLWSPVKYSKYYRRDKLIESKI